MFPILERRIFDQMQASKGTWRLRHAVADTDKAVDY